MLLNMHYGKRSVPKESRRARLLHACGVMARELAVIMRPAASGCVHATLSANAYAVQGRFGIMHTGFIFSFV